MKPLFLLAGIALSAPAFSGSIVDGNKLYTYFQAYERFQATQNAEDELYAGAYLGYITAMHDATDLQTAIPFCFPQNVTAGQLADITGKYLREYPENRAWSAGVIAWTSWGEPFICGGDNAAKPSPGDQE